jgi:hypothetical protein
MIDFKKVAKVLACSLLLSEPTQGADVKVQSPVGALPASPARQEMEKVLGACVKGSEALRDALKGSTIKGESLTAALEVARTEAEKIRVIVGSPNSFIKEMNHQIKLGKGSGDVGSVVQHITQAVEKTLAAIDPSQVYNNQSHKPAVGIYNAFVEMERAAAPSRVLPFGGTNPPEIDPVRSSHAISDIFQALKQYLELDAERFKPR